MSENSGTSELLQRRVEKVLPSQGLLDSFLKKQKIRVYLGVDPTGNRLHLGHAIGLSKLMDFANAGHKAILLFGTGTVLVGDPSLRDSARKVITQAEIDANIKDWKSQASKIVDFSKVEVKQNAEWLAKLKLEDIINIASNVSAVQLFKRESFQRRLDKGDTVWYHETMYPLLQGYDSVVLDVDLEIGGSDQEFNMLMGRELLKKMKNKEKYVLTTPMIVGTDGKQMSKTSDNCVWLDDTAEEMFGKLMRVPDSEVMTYYQLCTNVDEPVLAQEHKHIQSGNPRDVKARMAQAVVEIYHGKEAALKSLAAFNAQFREGKIPDDIPVFEISDIRMTKNVQTGSFLRFVEIVSSVSEGHRILEQGGFKLNGKKYTRDIIDVKTGDIIQVGKRKFAKIVVK